MFTSSKGGTLIISGEPIKVGTQLKYPIVCSICHSDFDLFPKEVYSNLGNLRKGHDPCGCAAITRWTEDQNKVRVERECKIRKYNFLGFSGEYSGSSTKLKLECVDYGHVWESTTLHKFINGKRGCPKCKAVKVSTANSKPQEHFTEIFDTSGKFLEGTRFTKNTYKTNNLGYCNYWDVCCPVCSYDEYVLKGLCTGVFTTTYSSLKAGSKPCRCSFKYSWTKDQREYQILNICLKEGLTFIRWESDKDRPLSEDYFSWRCVRGHTVTSGLDAFLNAGYRCKSCSNANSTGLYDDKLSDVDYLYLLKFTSDCECFIKIGRSFNVDSRLATLRSESPYTIELLSTSSGIHSEIYKQEQSWHDYLKEYHYTPLHSFGGSVLECFSEDSLRYIQIEDQKKTIVK
ncbi:hypothetical protein NVP1063O_171 [Vibrio phage 1.063.O._10N.261.45.C7]|nr:hypothetical protein NVP1063O_171 [Vibrio phage 1.063.O._10N.261.45.C7]